jgi:hypothetical protein
MGKLGRIFRSHPEKEDEKHRVKVIFGSSKGDEEGGEYRKR